MLTEGRSAFKEACRQLDTAELVDLAFELISIWSPPGAEQPVAERLGTALAAAGAKVQLDERFPGTPTVLAEIGASHGPTLQWHGHMDAIDAPHPPPERRPDLIVGRGAADMKGPLAAMVTSARLLVENGLPRRGRVLITFHGLHETGGNEPLHDLIERGIVGDAVIIGELGEGRTLPIAGLGLLIWNIVVHGDDASVHELNAGPDSINPLEVGRLLLDRLAELRKMLSSASTESSAPSLFIGKLRSGDYFNRVPTSCEIAGSRRTDESTDLATAAAQLEAIVDEVRAQTGSRIELSTTAAAESYSIEPDQPIVRAVRRANFDLTGTELPFSRVAAAGNATTFVHEAGVPAVYFGPDYSSAHSDFEWVRIDDLRRVAAGFALATAYYFDELEHTNG